MSAAASAATGSGPGSSSSGSSAPASLQPTLKASGSLMPTALSHAAAAQHEFAMSSMLILPDSFGEIFLGNTFSSYISVINQYACDLRDVGLSVNIQCANDRVELHDNRYARTGKLPSANPAKVLPAGSSLDMVVDYPLNQIGNHVLRVGVTYMDPILNEQKSLRKFYRFAVQNPLVISFKQSKLQDQTFVEAEIRNVSKLALFVDSIKFLPLPPFAAEELDAAGKQPGADRNPQSAAGLLQAGPQSLLNPQEELQRVFRVTYDPTADLTTVSSLGAHNLGRLHVGWKTSVGEAGSVQSQPVMRKADSGRDVAVTLANLPKHIVCGVPFVATVRVANNSARNLQLQLQFRKDEMRGIVCHSISHQNIGLLSAQSVLDVPTEFLPTAGGLHAIRGVACVDLRSGQEFAQDELAHVLVHAMAAATVGA
ncbi:hypothetical protein PybrP1_009437 [[Pythium] brassicae (nom. inval.)]|nr:hypothetical protein PybrP1_009437 [[Pythium] brassicae (nom. inval.)]